ncbi:hypothetical protein [Streptomyces sp. IMTB 2501]|uniref:hypothetical protein n=1 Tax=Streptomyces sp. IMTB 2501 TaxID=1776340 RepID=UPI0015BC59A5|nr:hypothetical protein [Streptomyces sp. IMTB 2501]
MQAAVILVTAATEPATVHMAATVVIYAVETDGLRVLRSGRSRGAAGEESASGECRRSSSPVPA